MSIMEAAKFFEVRKILMPLIRSVTEKCRQILGRSSAYRNKKNVHISMCPETFNFSVVSERVHL
jgi:hypothetical protein